MALQTDSENIEGGSVTEETGDRMARLEAALQQLEPDRFEDFCRWVAEGQWTDSRSFNLARFKGAKVKTSISVSEDLLTEVIKRADQQGLKVSISTLLESLMWDFLGRPADLVETKHVRRPRRPRTSADEDPLGASTLTELLGDFLKNVKDTD